MVALRYFLTEFMFIAKHLQSRVCVCVCDIEARCIPPMTHFVRICLPHFILLQGFVFTGPKPLNQYLSGLEIHTGLKNGV